MYLTPFSNTIVTELNFHNTQVLLKLCETQYTEIKTVWSLI